MSQKLTVFNLRQMYHEFGTYDFKIVLDPENFKNSQGADLTMLDSDRKKMKHEVNFWGRKINCSFVIDDDVSDGVSMIDLNLIDSNGKKVHERLTFWVVKPN